MEILAFNGNNTLDVAWTAGTLSPKRNKNELIHGNWVQLCAAVVVAPNVCTVHRDPFLSSGALLQYASPKT